MMREERGAVWRTHGRRFGHGGYESRLLEMPSLCGASLQGHGIASLLRLRILVFQLSGSVMGISYDDCWLKFCFPVVSLQFSRSLLFCQFPAVIHCLRDSLILDFNWWKETSSWTVAPLIRDSFSMVNCHLQFLFFDASLSISDGSFVFKLSFLADFEVSDGTASFLM